MVVGYSARGKVSLAALNCAFPGQWLANVESEKVSGVPYSSSLRIGRWVTRSEKRLSEYAGTSSLPLTYLFRDSKSRPSTSRVFKHERVICAAPPIPGEGKKGLARASTPQSPQHSGSGMDHRLNIVCRGWLIQCLGRLCHVV